MSLAQRIVRAAIKHQGVVHSVPVPGRHHDCIICLADSLGVANVPHKDVEQGFLTSRGDFVDRVEAAQIALASGQVEKLTWPPRLFSEELW